MYSIKQKGMTLIELTVVLLILVALAGLTIPYVSGTSRKALCDATDVSMMNIKQVIMQRYYLDTLGKFPQDLSSLSENTGSEKYQLHFLFSNTSLGGRVHKDFDLDSQVGWNGPYLQESQILDAALTAGNYNSSTYTEPFLVGHHVVMDGWGRPFVLQVPTVAECKALLSLSTDPEKDYCARLVSAGSGSGLGSGNGTIDTAISAHKDNDGDDRMLYLSAPTPAQDINAACGE